MLGLSGLGQAWLVADGLWSSSRIVGVAPLALTVATWLWLLAGYGIRALRSPNAVKKEFEQPVQGAASALIGIATLLVPTDLLVRTAVDLIRRAIEAIRGRSAEPVPVLVPILIGATGRREKKLRSS